MNHSRDAISLATYLGLPAIVFFIAISPPVISAPNTFNTALPIAQEQFVWREQLLSRERSDGDSQDRKVSVKALVSVLGYGVNPNFSIFVVAPFFFKKSLDVDMPGGPVQRDADGLGDMTVFGRHGLYKEDFTGGTFRIASLLGATAPTGDYDDRDRFGELPRGLQTGDGAWDVFGGAVATYQSLQYQIDAQLLYRKNGRHDGYARGDEIHLDASLQYRILPREMTGISGTPGFVYALLELNATHSERDEAGQETIPSSGGQQWLLAPGLQYVSRNWIMEGTVQFPVAENPNGDVIQDDQVLRFGFRRSF